MKKHVIAALLLGAIALPLLQGCVPVIAAGATAGALSAFDRRSLGTQTEDETIEWKSSARVSEKFGDKVHINFTSFNRKVLLTGEVPTAEDKAEAEIIVSGVTNVQGVYNELTVGPVSSFSDRSNDSYITSKVKGRMVDSGKFNPVHVKVVTEAGVVFLLGMVTQPEADSAISVARTTSGVKKVVNLLEIITPAKARELDITQSNSSKPAPAETKNP
ncbi:MAG: BON domain-containing protein [Propionivibrio sp.]|uniref:BON domain-containing protein n=1 Tax=Propionivibrio sp. TaxID=2212460 RepID=UPI001A456D1E|nr:BON domain-containing protein [Propionivibrio sp.]MBL8415275.1 BON domain-containing protein [Propionivibrio sp.]